MPLHLTSLPLVVHDPQLMFHFALRDDKSQILLSSPVRHTLPLCPGMDDHQRFLSCRFSVSLHRLPSKQLNTSLPPGLFMEADRHFLGQLPFLG